MTTTTRKTPTMSDTPNPSDRDDTQGVAICDLQPHDKIPYDAHLGPVRAAETLTVKSAVPGLEGKYAVTFFRLGTLFLHQDLVVPVIRNG